MPWNENVYGLFGRLRGTSKKPRFLGYVRAKNAMEALSIARRNKVAKRLTIIEARPYPKLGRLRRVQVGFSRYADEVARGAV